VILVLIDFLSQQDKFILSQQDKFILIRPNKKIQTYFLNSQKEHFSLEAMEKVLNVLIGI